MSQIQIEENNNIHHTYHEDEGRKKEKGEDDRLCDKHRTTERKKDGRGLVVIVSALSVLTEGRRRVERPTNTDRPTKRERETRRDANASCVSAIPRRETTR